MYNVIDFTQSVIKFVKIINNLKKIFKISFLYVIKSILLNKKIIFLQILK